MEEVVTGFNRFFVATNLFEFSDVDFLKSFLSSKISPAGLLGIEPTRVPLRDSLQTLIENFDETTLKTVFIELGLDIEALEIELKRRKGEYIDVPASEYLALNRTNSKVEDSVSSIMKGFHSGSNTHQGLDLMSPRSKQGFDLEISAKSSPVVLPAEFRAQLERMKTKDNLVNIYLENSSKMLTEQTERLFERQKAIIQGLKEDSISASSPRKRQHKDSGPLDSPAGSHKKFEIHPIEEEPKESEQKRQISQTTAKQPLKMPFLMPIEQMPTSVTSKFALQLSARK